MNPVLNCRICENKDLQRIFNGKIRDGSYGKLTASDYSVLQCQNCKARFLDRFIDEKFYETEDYRKGYGGSDKIEEFWQAHDELWSAKLYKIGLHRCRNKGVADFGAGGGSFLDGLKGVARETIAVEPAAYWHDTLARNHRVFSYGRDLVGQEIKIDIGVSFDVIEHVPQPDVYLKEIYDALDRGGRLYLMTPNARDILLEFAEENFAPFFYRTAHSYYFCKDSLRYLLDKAGFKNHTIGFYHEMDISNLLYWLKEGRPTGRDKTKLFDDEANRFYRSYLEQHGRASHLWVEAEK